LNKPDQRIFYCAVFHEADLTRQSRHIYLTAIWYAKISSR